MSDHQQPEPDDADLDVTARPGSAGPRQRSRSGLPAIGLVAAMVVALVAGPAVASRLASTGAVSPGTYPDAGRLTEPGVPLPTLRPASTPCSTGENANQREGRSAFPTPTPTGEPGCP